MEGEETDDSGATELQDTDDVDLEDSITIGILLTTMVVTGMAVPLLVPIYPKEANERGITTSQYGFAFGIFDLAVLLCSIPFGQMGYVLPPRHLFISGIALECIYVTICASLDFIDNGLIFLFLTFLSQIFSGLGKLLVSITIFSIFPLLYPDNSATLISSADMLYRIGFIVGPTISGVLYELLGFYVPFVFVGTLFILILPIGWYFIPGDNHQIREEEEDEEFYKRVLSLPRVWISLCCGALIAGYISFLCVTFEPALRFLGFSAATVGIMFSLAAACAALSTIVWGIVCDKGINPLICMLVGILLVISGSVFLSFKGLYSVIPGQLLIGTGMGGMFHPSFLHMTHVCISNGFRDDVMTHGVMSGLYFVGMSLGGLLGATIGSILYDSVGFLQSNFAVTAAYIVLFAVIAITLVSDFIDSMESEEEDEEELCAVEKIEE